MHVPPAWRVFSKFQSGLGYEIPFKTRALYRSLLRESRRFEKPKVQSFLWNTVSERFRFHQHETSVPRAVAVIHEGERALGILRAALDDNTKYYDKIVAMSLGEIGPLAFVRDKMKKISNPSKRYATAMDIRPQSAKHRNPKTSISLPGHIMQVKLPTPQQHKGPKMRKRKPYQHAFKVESSSGRIFMRVRGWMQPVKTSMMIKNAVKTSQRRLDKFNSYQDYLSMLEGEALFLRGCGVGDDDIRGAAQLFRSALKEARQLHINSRSRADEELE